MATSIISCSNLGIRYRRGGPASDGSGRYQWVLRGFDLEVARGETLGVVGGNGAGKSSLLQTLAGIIAPNEGTVTRSTSRITMLSLNAGLQPTLSGRTNAILSGMLLGFSRREISDHIEKIKEFSELGDAFEARVMTYSTGMQSRLGFSAAAFLQPDVLLIDESLGAGDERFRKKSNRFMRQKIRGDITVVLVSHGLATIKELCDRAIWLGDGGAKAEGDPTEVVNAYKQAQRSAMTKDRIPNERP